MLRAKNINVLKESRTVQFAATHISILVVRVASVHIQAWSVAAQLDTAMDEIMQLSWTSQFFFIPM